MLGPESPRPPRMVEMRKVINALDQTLVDTYPVVKWLYLNEFTEDLLQKKSVICKYYKKVNDYEMLDLWKHVENYLQPDDDEKKIYNYIRHRKESRTGCRRRLYAKYFHLLEPAFHELVRHLPALKKEIIEYFRQYPQRCEWEVQFKVPSIYTQYGTAPKNKTMRTILV